MLRLIAALLLLTACAPIEAQADAAEDARHKCNKFAPADIEVRFKNCAIVMNDEKQLPRDRAAASNNLCVTWLEVGNVVEALNACERAVELQPKVATYHANVGTALYRFCRYQEAIAKYSEAIALEPDLAFAYHNRALAYHKSGRFMAALLDSKKVHELLAKEEGRKDK